VAVLYTAKSSTRARIRKKIENQGLLTLIGFSERKYTIGITDKEACLLLIGTIQQ